ncbi:hypothetical protein B566_EDAN010200 [Ephemera danica]|nr:hypothetical protein B566_EDAN010200 [Ephemera danica]
MMAVDNIDRLYQIYDVLSSAGEKIGEYEKEYTTLLEAVKGSDKEKRLASQFIPKFFKHFPKLIDRSIESQFDLCEDEDILIRKQAVRDLPNFCRDHKEYSRKISDILAQLLQVEDSGELSVVYTALMNLFKIEAKGTLAGLYNQILTGEEIVRERCIKFLASKYRHLESDVINKEAEDFVIAETRKVLQDVTAEEFRVLMGVLGHTRLGKSVSGHQELVSLVAEQAELDQPLGTPDPETIDRLIACARHAIPYFSSQVESTRFLAYMCEEVLPVLGDVPRQVEEGGGGSDTTLEILKLTAELCAHAATLEQPITKLEPIFQKLIEYMPLPPVDDESPQKEEGTQPKLEFSYVECLLYTLHRLGRQCPEFLADNPDRLKDFRIRLQYFARGAQGYMKKLKEILNQKKAKSGGDEERSLQAAALQTTSNILLLIKDLFHTPPSYKSSVTLSFATPATSKEVKKIGATAEKRHAPITFGNGNQPKHLRADRGDRVIYQPPSGKYSEKISNYAPSNWRGGRGRFRGGGFRGNRTWRNNSY